MCLSDLGTAVLIGGEGVDQQSCKDALWKLEIGGDLGVSKAMGAVGHEENSCRWEGGTQGSVHREGTAKMSHLLVYESPPGAKV